MKKSLPYTVVDILDMYLKIEKLFSAGEVKTELFSRSLSYPEMLSHYFRTASEKEKGLPEEFLDDVNSAAECFSRSGNSENTDDPVFYFFNIYRSHKNRKNKDEILKQVFSAFEQICFPEDLMEKLLSLLDRIINLFPSSSVYDYAVSARYAVFDRKKLEEVKDKSRARLDSVINTASVSENILETDIEFIRDSGSYIVPEILNLSLSDDPVKQEHGFSFTSIRFNRDRKILGSTGFRHKNTYLFSADIEKNKSGARSYISVIDENDLDKFDPDTALYCSGKAGDNSGMNELLLFVRCSSEDECGEVFRRITDRIIPAEIEF